MAEPRHAIASGFNPCHYPHIYKCFARDVCLVVIELSYVPRGYGKRSESGTEDAVEATSYHGEEVGI